MNFGKKCVIEKREEKKKSMSDLPAGPQGGLFHRLQHGLDVREEADEDDGGGPDDEAEGHGLLHLDRVGLLRHRHVLPRQGLRRRAQSEDQGGPGRGWGKHFNE